jgi:hypothetical protein
MAVKSESGQQVEEEDGPASVQVSAYPKLLALLAVVKSSQEMIVWLQLCNPQHHHPAAPTSASSTNAPPQHNHRSSITYACCLYKRKHCRLYKAATENSHSNSISISSSNSNATAMLLQRCCSPGVTIF